jgi:hypothetical protein
MNAQHKIKAQKQTLFLLLLLTCAFAVAGGKLTAQAEAASTQAAVNAASSQFYPPPEPTGTTRRKPTVIPGRSTLPIRVGAVNKFGVLAPGGRLALVDDGGHIVSQKGTRVGGRTGDDGDTGASHKMQYLCRSITVCHSL